MACRSTKVLPYETRARLPLGLRAIVALSWLADALPALDGPTPATVPLDHPVIAAAEEWLESSLAVREGASPAPGAAA